MKSLEILSAILFVVGALNWGLGSLFDFDVVAVLFGEIGSLSHVVYAVVGLSAVHQGLGWRSIRLRWGVTSAAAP